MTDIKLNKLKGYRNGIGKTQEEMAKKLGISKQSYNYKENKKVAFSDDEKIKIKSILIPYFPNVTIEDIFF